MLTDEQLAQIRARAEAATPGEWTYFPLAHHVGSDVDGAPAAVASIEQYDSAPDGTFIAAARQDIPALLAEVERLRADVTFRDGCMEQLTQAYDALAQERNALRKVIDDVQEFVVLHFFDMRCGREVDALITERMQAFDTMGAEGGEKS